MNLQQQCLSTELFCVCFCEFVMSANISNSWVWLTGTLCSPTRLPLALMFSVRNQFKSLKRMTPPKPQDWFIITLALGSFAAIWILILALESPMEDIKKQYWLASLVFNLISYSAIFLPGFLVLRYVVQTNYLESGPQPKMLGTFIKLCYYGNQEETIDESIEGKM